MAHKLLRTGSAVRCECQGDISRQMAVGTLCYPSPSPSVRTSSPNQVVRRFAGRQLSFSVVALVMVRNASWSGRVVAFHYCSDQGFRSSRHSCNTSFPYLEGLDEEELGSTYAPCVVPFGLHRILGPAPLGLSRFTSRRALRLSASCCRPCERFHL